MKKISGTILPLLLALLMAVPASFAAGGTDVFIPDKLRDLDGLPAIEDIWEDKVFFLSVRFYHEVIEISADEIEELGRGVELWFTDFDGNPFVPDHAEIQLFGDSCELEIDENGYCLFYAEEGEVRWAPETLFFADKTYEDGTAVDITFDVVPPAFSVEKNGKVFIYNSEFSPEPPASESIVLPGLKPDNDFYFFSLKERTAGTEDHRLMCVPVEIDYTLPDTDFFLTGMENAVTTVTYQRNTVASVCGDGQDPEHLYTHYDGFYSVTAVDIDYPAGNYIGWVSTAWRNDKKQELASYKIIYHVSDNELYCITYAPQTTSIFEDHTEFGPGIFTYRGVNYSIPEDEAYTDLGKQDVCGKNVPSMKTASGDYVHHYTADEPIYGKFYKSYPDWEDDSVWAESGSGDNLKKWYDPDTFRQIRSIRYPCTYFTSPRVTK